MEVLDIQSHDLAEVKKPLNGSRTIVVFMQILWSIYKGRILRF